MTQKLNKPLFNSFDVFIVFLIVPLVGFFIFGFFVDTKIFTWLAVGIIFSFFYLIPLRNRLSQAQTETQMYVQDVREQKNLLESDIKSEEKAIEAFRGKIVNYAQLKGLTEKLSLSLTPDDTSKILVAEVNKFFGDEDTVIILYLFHSRTGELGLSSSQKGQMRVNIKSKKGDSFDQWIIKNMQPLLIEDTKSDFRFDHDKIILDETRLIRSLVSVPLIVQNKALGILRVDSPKVNYFQTEDLRFLTTIGDLGAIAIENAQLYEHVQQLAIKDGLTNLYLQRYLLERMSEEVSRQLRRKEQLSFLMIDLDKFKHYNDKYGHMAGDIVLRTTAMLLAQFFNQPGNLVCRYGGEEFCVLLPDCSKPKAIELAQKLRHKIESQTIILRREKTHVTVSIGVASFPKDAQSKEELIHKADQALYQAKGSGRNKVCSG